ncbi:MAG: hypothetical protein J0I96_04525 [Rhodanobacter sp.]|nr:hypothetical protein [Rhodanobacter sp.]
MNRRIVLVDIGEGLSLSGILPSVALHGSYSAKLVARGGSAPYSFTTGSLLPDGLTLDRATGIFSASDVATPGTFGIVVTVMDIGGSTATRTFVLQVIAQPLVATGHAPDGSVGTAYSYTYAANGGTPPYTWSIVGGALQSGLSFDQAAGKISGVPTAGGEANWTVRVSDAGEQIFDLADGATFAAPALNLSGTYPSGNVGSAYSADLTITGGVAPYNNPRVTSGTLPDGLSLSVVGDKLRLSGTPTTVASSSFTAAVDSSDGQTATSAQNVSVSAVTANYFDPAKKGVSFVLSNSNKTASVTTPATSWESAFGVDGSSDGYFEVLIVDAATYMFVGVGNASAQTNSFVGSNANGWGYSNNLVFYNSGTSKPALNSWDVGDVIGCCVKDGNIWWSYNGNWINGDPSTNASPTYTGLSGVLYPIVSGSNSSSFSKTTTLRELASEFSYPIPAGSHAWAH